MPLNEKKIISIILEECKKVSARCKGYREELIESIGDIVQLEQQNRTHGTNIQQKVTDKCNATGHFLAEHRGHHDTERKKR